MSDPLPQQPLDVIRWITIRLHDNGTLSTAGTIGDLPMALHMLECAKDALKGRDDPNKLLIPNYHLETAPNRHVRALGSMLPEERGDP